jgi:hypothetical protein
MVSISSALARIKQSPAAVLNRATILKVCDELDLKWRERELDPATTLSLFVQQILHGNVPCSEVRHIAGRSFTASAYCQARRRLPLSVCQSMLGKVVEAALPATRQEQHLWNGHRVFHIDGSSFSMPDTAELRKVFGGPTGQKPGCGFPAAHLLVLFNAQTGLLLDAWASRLNTGDMAQVGEAHQHLGPGDVVIGDDTFSNYVHLALLLQAKLHGLFPVHHMRIVDFTPGRPHTVQGKYAMKGLPRSRWIKSLGKEDQLVEYFKPKEKPDWMSRQQFDTLPESIVVREARRTVRQPGLGKITVTMVTTLLDPKTYPAGELTVLRWRRWDVETSIGHLKTTMKMDVLHCKTEAGVRKELAVFCLVYNLVRVVMLEAARRQEVAVARISFADALKRMRHARPGDVLPALMLVPWRPNRLEPRCVKRRSKQFDLMNRPRSEMRNELIKQRKKH